MMKMFFKNGCREACGGKIVRLIAGLSLMSAVGCTAHHSIKMDADLVGVAPEGMGAEIHAQAQNQMESNGVGAGLSRDDSRRVESQRVDPSGKANFWEELRRVRGGAHVVYVPVLEMEERINDALRDNKNKSGDPELLRKKETEKEMRAFAAQSGLSAAKTSELMEIVGDYTSFFYNNLPSMYKDYGPFQSSFGDGLALIALPSDIQKVNGPLTKGEKDLSRRVIDAWGFKDTKSNGFRKKFVKFLTFHETAHAEKAHNEDAWQNLMKTINLNHFFEALDSDNCKEEKFYQETYADTKAFAAMWKVEKDPELMKEIIYFRAINMILEPDHGTISPLIAVAKKIGITDIDFPEMSLKEAFQAQQGLMKSVDCFLSRDAFAGIRQFNLEKPFIKDTAEKIQEDFAAGKITDPHQKACAAVILEAATHFGILKAPDLGAVVNGRKTVAQAFRL